MSIVGAAGVSLKDLTNLGVPTLTAMAQGKMQSVAPSYMVLAALKSLVDAQSGAGVPAPQGTVKDAVVSAAQPPMQAGIGRMMPQQSFSGGGHVQKFSGGGTPEAKDRESILSYLKSLGMGAEGLGRIAVDAAALVPRGVAGAYNSAVVRPMRAFGLPAAYLKDVNGGDFSELMPFWNEYKRRVEGVAPEAGTTATAPTENPALPYSDERYARGRPAEPTRQETPTPPTGRGSGSARVGIAAAGNNPNSKYVIRKPEGMKETPGPENFKLDLKPNEYLQQVFDRYGQPDPRMQQMKDAERSMGLAAFAENIMKGRGLGGAFPGAASAAVREMQGRADKRMELEAARERMRDELGIKIGDRTREDYLANVNYGNQRSDKAFDQESTRAKIDIDAAQATNTGNYQRDSLRIQERQVEAQFAAAKEAAAARRDSNLLQRLSTLENSRLQRMQDVYNAEIKIAENSGQMLNPRTRDTVIQNAQIAAQKVGEDYMRRIRPVLKQLGIED
jgi:hypothetical protein